jgi:serine/threonine protein kinase
MGDKTKKGTQILGSTERWMSYEYNYTDTVSPKTDVWSLGCLIFYVFSNGNLPYSKCRDGSEVAACIKEKKDFFDCVEQ